MTAASGILHEEFHSEKFAREGGTLEMAQLWVNLRAGTRTRRPAIRRITIATSRGAVARRRGYGTGHRGEFGGKQGPARTFSPMDVWDVRPEGREAGGSPAGRGRGEIVVLAGTSG